MIHVDTRKHKYIHVHTRKHAYLRVSTHIHMYIQVDTCTYAYLRKLRPMAGKMLTSLPLPDGGLYLLCSFAKEKFAAFVRIFI